MWVDVWRMWSSRFRRFDFLCSFSTLFYLFIHLLSTFPSSEAQAVMDLVMLWPISLKKKKKKANTRGDNSMEKESDKEVQKSLMKIDPINGIVWFLLSSSFRLQYQVRNLVEVLFKTLQWWNWTKEMPPHPLHHLFSTNQFVCVSIQATQLTKIKRCFSPKQVIHSHWMKLFHDSTNQHKKFDFWSFFSPPLIKESWKSSLHY